MRVVVRQAIPLDAGAIAQVTVTAESATRWKVAFTDGYSVVVQVPKLAKHSVQSVLFGPENMRDLRVFVACYRQAFG